MKIWELTERHAVQLRSKPGFIYVDVFSLPLEEHELRIVVPVSRAKPIYSYGGRILAVLGEQYPPDTRQASHELCDVGVAIGIWSIAEPSKGAAVKLTPEDARGYAQEILRLADEWERLQKEEETP